MLGDLAGDGSLKLTNNQSIIQSNSLNHETTVCMHILRGNKHSREHKCRDAQIHEPKCRHAETHRHYTDYN